MFNFTEVVKASSIWDTSKDYIDEGPIEGLVRGYNVEVRLPDGRTDWDSAAWFHGSPEYYFDDDFHQYWYSERQVQLTGRICFRGYGIEAYDHEIGEYIIECDSQGNEI